MRARVLLGLVVLVAALVPPIVLAAPAYAGPGTVVAACPPGTFEGFTGLCYNSRTKNVQRLPNGSPIGTNPKGLANAPKVHNTASVLKATGANSGEAVAATEAAAAKNGGRLALATRTVGGRIVPVVGAFMTGFAIGQLLTETACSAGADVLCMPVPGPGQTYTPNADVSALPGDRGWVYDAVSGLTYTNGQGNVTWSNVTAKFNSLSAASNCIYGGAKCDTDNMQIVTKAFSLTGAETQPTSGTQGAGFQFSLENVCGPSGNPAGGPYTAETGSGVNSSTLQFFVFRSAGAAPYVAASGSGNNGGAFGNALVGSYSGNRRALAGSSSTQGCGSGKGYAGAMLKVNRLDGSGTASGWLTSTGALSSTLAGGALAYRFQGDANRPGPVAANPERRVNVTNTCLNPDGTTTTTSATGVAFTETAAIAQGYVPAPANVPACPNGGAVTGTKITETGTGVPDRDLGDVTVPQPIIDNQVQFPQCQGGKCVLTLFKVDAAGRLLDCAGTTGLCTGWYDDPDKATHYTCRYGTTGGPTDASVALSECNVYRPTFDPEQTSQCNYYANAEGVASTGNNCGTEDPTGGGTTADGSACFPSGWGAFNPLSWVLQPVKCALLWAFVPSPAALSAATTSITTAYDQTTLGEWKGLLLGVGAVSIPDAGCGGMTLTIPTLGPINRNPASFSVFGTCDEPWKTVAAVVKAFLTVMVIWGTCVGVWRNLSSSIGLESHVGSQNGR